MDGETCAEVLEVLRYVPQEDYDKIPRELVNAIMQRADEKSEFKYNTALSFREHGISRGAKELLAEIARRWWVEG